MPNILEQIVAATRTRVAQQKEHIPPHKMRDAALSHAADRAALHASLAAQGTAPVRMSFASALALPALSFICEVKKASPSKGLIAKDFPYLEIAQDYEAAGAAALSVLTEPDFFRGAPEYLHAIAQVTALPLLRKDFIVDAYQIDEACTLNASAVLLICSILDDAALAALLVQTHERGLDALVEAHNAEEVKRALDAGARIIGVNNRDLKSFEVDLTTSLELRARVPREILFVSESGISTPEDIALCRAAGVDAVLVGESMMRAANKRAFLEALRGD